MRPGSEFQFFFLCGGSGALEVPSVQDRTMTSVQKRGKKK